jgi:hypothetical protein
MPNAKKKQPGALGCVAAPNPAAEVLTPTIPADIQALLGEPPALPGDDRAKYNQLILQISKEMRPSGIVDWLFVEDFVHATFQIHALRSAKRDLLNDARLKELQPALHHARVWAGWTLDDLSDDVEVSVHLFAEEPQQRKAEIEKELAEVGITLATVMARGMVRYLDKIEAIDRMIGVETARRDAALREADRWRNGLGRRLDRLASDIVDIDTA